MRTLLALLALLALPLAAAHAQVKEGWEEPPAQTQPAAEEDAPRGGPREYQVLPPANSQPLIKDMNDLEKAADGIKKTGESIIQRIEQIITAQVFFPAKTFRAAVEDAATGMVEEPAKAIVDSITKAAVEHIVGSFDVFRAKEVTDMAKTMQEASLPILAIGLVIAILSALAGEAVGLGNGPSSMGAAFVRWLFVALATANASALLVLIHDAFGYLILFATAKSFDLDLILKLIMPAAGLGLINYIVLIIVAMATGLVIVIATVARLAVLAILHVIAPLCIASASLPFGAPIFGQWLTMFVKAELLGVANAVLMITGVSLAGRIKYDPIMSPLFVLAIFGVLLALNLALAKNVFGGVVAIAQLGLRATGAAISLLAGGLGGAFAAKRALAFAGATTALGGSNSGSSAIGGGGSGGGGGASVGGSSGSGSSSSASSAASAVGSAAATLYAKARDGWGRPVETILSSASGGDPRTTRLAEEIGERLGIRDAAGVERITRALREGVDVGGGARIGGQQLAQNIRQTAPIIEALVEQFSNRSQSSEARREEAAAKLGFASYTEMAISLSAYQNAQGATPQEVIGGTMNAWMQSPPDKISPLWDKDAPYDYAMGTFVSRVAGASSARAPLWAKTMGSLRRAFGDEYVSDFARRVTQERWDERRMMAEVDNKVNSVRKSADPVEAELANKVVRFWRPGEAEARKRR